MFGSAQLIAAAGARSGVSDIRLARGAGWAVALGEDEFSGAVRVTRHELEPAGSGDATVVSVRGGFRRTVRLSPGTGPYVFVGIGLALEWLSADGHYTFYPVLFDDGADSFPLGAYLEAGAGADLGAVILFCQASAGASLLFQEVTLDDAGLTTWGLSAGAGVRF
jgi:hypothetical protein